MKLEDGGSGIGIWLAYGAIVAFVVLLAVVVLRTVVLYSFLLILPIGRLLRRVPMMGGLVDRLERSAGARTHGERATRGE